MATLAEDEAQELNEQQKPNEKGQKAVDATTNQDPNSSVHQLGPDSLPLTQKAPRRSTQRTEFDSELHHESPGLTPIEVT